MDVISRELPDSSSFAITFLGIIRKQSSKRTQTFDKRILRAPSRGEDPSRSR